jgi:dGTPase
VKALGFPNKFRKFMTEYHEYLAPYACHPLLSRGRLHSEDESPTRSPFQRDRDRVIHCGTFRRLKHKTQVFVYHEGDYYRTRLTHSIEVSQIARSVCRALRLNEDITEALALAHDFGHTPFGHAGEDALDDCMRPHGGFDHNAQSLRLVTKLEQRYADFPGLNLTWETLEGLAKHNGPLVDGPIDPLSPPASLPFGIREYVAQHDLEIHSFASAEAQVAAVCDDIAYNNHDIEDGLRAGLFSIDDLAGLPLIGDVIAHVRGRYPDIQRDILIHEVVRRLINSMVVDLISESQKRLDELNPASVNEIRAAGAAVIAFSEEMIGHDRALKAYLSENMYGHDKVLRMAKKGKKVVRDLFSLYIGDPASMPREWASKTKGRDANDVARVVADFIAGMTDRFALMEHKKIV